MLYSVKLLKFFDVKNPVWAKRKGEMGQKAKIRKFPKNRWLWLGKKRLSKRKVKIKLTISTMLSEGIFGVGFGIKTAIQQIQIHI